MATKKDLVEAYSFSRRRLVTAFVSGAPGGREVEPARPGRSIIGGLALAVLLVAGGVVVGFLKNPSAPDWDSAGLITEKETGAAYLNMPPPDGEGRYQLRPLQNITSALLVLNGQVEAERVPHDRISDRPRGPGIGILGAPATPPEAGKLVQTGWTACTTDASEASEAPQEPTGTDLTISAETDVVADADQRFVVRTSKGLWLIAQAATRDFSPGERAYRYRVPESGATNLILSAVGGTNVPVDVPDEWIGLFPQGADLALNELAIGAVGTPWAGAGYTPAAAGAKVGGLLRVGGSEEYYLLTGDERRAIKLDAFSLELYERLRGPDFPQQVIDVERGPSDFVEIGRLEGLRWPSEIEPGPPVQGRLCAVLDARAAEPGVLLGTTPTVPGASPEDLDGSVVVDSGAGAFVYSGDWAEGPTTPVLVDDQGTRFPVGQQAEESRLLGYGDVAKVVVPDSWLDLLQDGVELSRAAALCPPSPQPGGGGCVPL